MCRCISRVRAAVPPPAGTRHDWAIAVDFARRLEQAIGVGSEFRTTASQDASNSERNSAPTPIASPWPKTLFPYATPESIWNEHRESTRGRDLDITGMSYEKLEASPLQWPMAEGRSYGKARLYEDGIFPTAWLPDTQALTAREQLRRIMDRFPFASCVPFSSNVPLAESAAQSRSGVLLRAAGHEAPAGDLLAQIEALLGLQGADVLRYADPRRGQRRVIRLLRDGADAHLEAFLLAGDTSAQAWMLTLLQEDLPAQAYGRLLLSPGGKAPVAVRSRGKPVCTCLNVTDLDIAGHLAGSDGDEAMRLSALQTALKCGTNCGSCIPELRRMVRAAAVAPEPA